MCVCVRVCDALNGVQLFMFETPSNLRGRGHLLERWQNLWRVVAINEVEREAGHLNPFPL